MRATDFFVEEAGHSAWGPGIVQTTFDQKLLKQVIAGPVECATDRDVAGGLLDLVQEELEAYGTGGGQQLEDPEIALAISALEAVTRRLGMTVKLPFRDFTRFKSYWVRNDGYGSWQARRDIVESLLEPPRTRLAALESSARPELPETSIANLRDPAAIQEQLNRIQRVIFEDPPAAIGSAKELIESTAKTVLLERGEPVNEKDDVPALVSQAQKALGLHPASASPGPDGSDSIKKILGAMVTVATGLAELRNRYGTGHGRSTPGVALGARHAHLAVNASITWCQLMLDTLADPNAPWRSGST